MALSRMSDRVGQVLSERYRLLAPIGTGASASVYLADDVTLRRRVAVKILHDALSRDESFLRRFRAEAQAAAALNHPNIMSVYDWGQDDVPFLVTEYLGGGSLRTILDQGRLLTPAQTLMVGLEAARGLDYAHRRGFVHRDIKPANLLFDEEARLRIADFGLARALAEAAWTEPQGAVLGTARYASPEQARGETLDGRSDVYSLALVMIEAATGSVPFSTDTTIGTLMARVDKPIVVPAVLGPLREALEAAGAPAPADRPDAARFARLLMSAAEQLERPAPLVLAGTMVHHRDVVADRDPTVMRHPEAEPAIMAAPPGAVTDGIRVIPDAAVAAGSAGAGSEAPATRVFDHLADDTAGAMIDLTDDDTGRQRLGRRARRRAAAASAVPPPFDLDAEADVDGGGRRRWPRRAALLALVLLVAGLGGWGYWYTQVRIATHEVPVLVGTDVSSLEDAIGGYGFVVARTDVAQDGTVAGQILAQDPPPGTPLAEGATLALTVSTGPPPIDVPTDLPGQTLAAATAELQGIGLAPGEVTRRFDEDAPKDVVLALADGVPTQLTRGGGVGLVVSDGPKPRVVPDTLVGAAQADAIAAIQRLGLVAAATPDWSDTVPVGTVMRVDPGAGTSVPRGSTVTVVVSQGPKPVVVPDVSRRSVTDAATLLQQAGLTVGGVKGSPLGTVTGTDPKAGTTVKKGTAVTIITG